MSETNDCEVERKMESNDQKRFQQRYAFVPYWEVKDGNRVEVFIDGISRGVFQPLKDARFYAFPVYESDGLLPF